MAKDITIIANDLYKVYGTPNPLIVRLLDGNVPVPGKIVKINIHGVDYLKTTDSQGYARLNINLIYGTYPATVKFEGDSVYNPASQTCLVRVIEKYEKLETVSRNFFEVNKIPLRVIMDDGVEVSFGMNVKETQLLRDSDTHNTPTYFFDSGFDGDEFEINIMMRQEYFYNNRPVSTYLNNWAKYLTPLNVVTNAMDVPNGKYILTIKKKKQTYEKFSIWQLRFKQFYENNQSFESMNNYKLASLSVVDQLLLQQIQITKNSPKTVIYALQCSLRDNGYWIGSVKDETTKQDVIISTNDGPQFKARVPNGVWDWQMEYDIFRYQSSIMKNTTKNGVCDRDTIESLVGYKYEQQFLNGALRYG